MEIPFSIYDIILKWLLPEEQDKLISCFTLKLQEYLQKIIILYLIIMASRNNVNHPSHTNHGGRHEHREYNNNNSGGLDTGADYPLGYSNYSYPIFYPIQATDYTIMETSEVVDPIVQTTYQPLNDNYSM
jgi:hypothetical protein